MNPEAIFWLVLLVIFLVIEAGTVALVSLWFAAGSLAALLIWGLGLAPVYQAAAFILVSAAALTLLRPMMAPKKTATNTDAVIGTAGYVTADIDNLTAEGQVKLGAMYWTARSSTGERIPKGTLVKADRIEGVKVFVTPAPVPEEAR